MWRNWQTRRSQKPVMVTSWRFKSSHPHHDLRASWNGSPFLICLDGKWATLPRLSAVRLCLTAEMNSIIYVEAPPRRVGRRSLKRWDDRKCWWMDLPDALCRKAHVDTGDRVKLSVRIASEELPVELARLIKIDPAARARWERLTPGQQRMLREEILAAKQPVTRERRAARALGISVLSCGASISRQSPHQRLR